MSQSGPIAGAVDGLRRGMVALRGRFAINYLSLSSLSGLNLLFSILTLSWLVRVLGAQGYGHLALHQYAGQATLVLLDFGFPLYAVNEVARRSGDVAALRSLYAAVYAVKLGLLVGVGLLVGAALLGAWSASDGLPGGLDATLALGFVCASAAVSFQPAWFFQGMETAHVLIVPGFLARAAALIAIVVFVRGPEDVWVVPLASFAGGAAVGLHLHLRVRARLGAGLLHGGFAGAGEVFRGALEVFWSRLAVASYATTSPFLVDALVGHAGVAVYSLAEKTLAVARIPFDVAGNAFYTRAARGYDRVKVRRMLAVVLVLGAAASVVAAVGADLVIRVLAGDEALPGMGLYLGIYLLALPAVAVHVVVGTSVLLVHDLRRAFTGSILFALGCYALILVALYATGRLGIGGVIAAMVAVEYAVLFARLFHARRAGLI